KITRIACIVNTKDPLYRGFVAEAATAAKRLDLGFQPGLLQSVGELDNAFGGMVRDGVEAVVLQPIFVVDPQNIKTVVELTLKHRLPVVSGLARFAEAGGLIAYAAEFPDLPQRSAEYVIKILKGSKAGDLPVERPTRFQLLFNLKTANALGVTIPPSML